MRKLEWDKVGEKIHGGHLQHLCFADDIVLITLNISQAERMLADLDTCGKIDLQLNLVKTMYMKNGWVLDAPLTLNGTNISGCVRSVEHEWRIKNPSVFMYIKLRVSSKHEERSTFRAEQRKRAA